MNIWLASGEYLASVMNPFAPSLEGGAVWNHADGKIYFRAETGFDNFIYRLDPSDGKIIRIGTSMPYVKDFSITT